MKTISPRKVELTLIKNGVKQTVILTKVDYMDDALFATAKKVHAAAGNELLSYRVIAAVTEAEEKDNYTECCHCKATVDMRTAYMEVHKWSRGAGHYVDVKHYYCPSCRDMRVIGGI